MDKIKIISREDGEYPKRLLEIRNPPKKLYVKGDYTLLNKKSIAIVGSRKCSEYGIEQSYKFAEELSKQDICIISGLAIGIDTSAHLGSYKNVGKTIAVLGCGINKMYPEENIKLSEDILKNGGCIVSECDIDEEAVLKKFPKRNRIIAGIAMGTLVVEAKCKGGSIVTARLTNEQEKPVFCIPGDLGKKERLGTNLLIKDYGILVTEVEDIFNELNLQYDREILSETRKKNKRKKERADNRNSFEKQVCKEYEPVYRVFQNEPLSINEIYLKSGISISEVNQILTMLELEGLVKKEAGNRFVLI